MRYRDFDIGGESIFIMCGLLKNGKVNVKISGQLPNIYIIFRCTTGGGRENRRIEYDKDDIIIRNNGYKVNPNENPYFIYKYKMTMSLKSRKVKY